MFEPVNSWVEKLDCSVCNANGVELAILREDKIHPSISGNKWRKLKYNLQAAKNQGHGTLLTFGGAFSNHIAAVAEAGELFGFKTIGVIRGEQHEELNPTLEIASRKGMQFVYVDRDAYRNKSDDTFLADLKTKLGEFYLIPEGGSNSFGVQGCEEILHEQTLAYDYICCAMGTGATLAGIILSASDQQRVMGFPALKNGDFLKQDVEGFLNGIQKANWGLETDYHFGGYAKVAPELIAFMNEFYLAHKIPLDPIYTGKMMFGIMDLIAKGHFAKGSKILSVHTGGLQGIKGINQRLLQQGIRISYEETA
ncbi:MAG: 1-aminocyclopropane-1-carboxylate deaminase [Flavobacteriales bacterium]|jgi:1-aminocyclopropane-1-carboxylate deaminase